MAKPTLLEIDGVSQQFGGLQALNNVCFNVETGEILALIGPNGAGKTTLFNIIAGAMPPTNGRIAFKGRSIAGLRADARCRLGIARTFQIPRPFLPLSIADNVRVGAIFGRRMPTKEVDPWIDSLLERLGLTRWRNDAAETLPLGARKKLELARALSTGPELLLLDEVMGGLTPGEVDEVMDIVRSIRGDGVTVVFVEHVMQAVMALSDRVVVLSQGEIISEGTPAQVTQDPKVINAYLGGSLDA